MCVCVCARVRDVTVPPHGRGCVPGVRRMCVHMCMCMCVYMCVHVCAGPSESAVIQPTAAHLEHQYAGARVARGLQHNHPTEGDLVRRGVLTSTMRRS